MKKTLLVILICSFTIGVMAKKVKFAVDLTGLTVSTNGVHVTGDFQTLAGFEGGDWSANTTLMTREGTTDIFSIVVDIPAFRMYEYRFVNGDQFYDTEFVPTESRVGYDYDDNRWIYIDSIAPDTTSWGAIMFAGNAPKDKLLTRFLVDLQNETEISPAGVHVAGDFQQWNPSALSLYSFIDSVYEVIAYVDPGTYYYKFINGNSLNDAEVVSAECAVNENREMVITADQVLAQVCYAGCSLCASVPLPDQDFYDPEVIQSVEIHFSQPDWDYQMDTAKMGSDGYTIADWIKINGSRFDSVGVKYKGNSSYDSSYTKNPLHIELDNVISQSYNGVKDIKMANIYGDPSMIREVLSYNILKNYMICPHANFAKVYINGEYIGLYSNTEAIGKSFCKNYFNVKGNTLISCSPVVIPSPATKSNLKYLSADSTDYFDFYEIKSDYGWNDLLNLCNTLTNEPANAADIINMDRVLWMLAFDQTMVNLDSYLGVFSQNYYLYRDNTGKFTPIIWDVNMSLGGFPYIGNSNTSMGSLSITDMQQLSPLVHANDPYWPLINIVMNDPLTRKMYFAHMRTIASEMLESGQYQTMAAQYQALIDNAVQSDTNKFFTYEDFLSGMSTDVPFGSYVIPGISNLVEARVDFLNTVDEFIADAPVISSLTPSSETPVMYENIDFLTAVTNADEVYMKYRYGADDDFSTAQMFDDGNHHDGAANDHIFGLTLGMESVLFQYYIYANNAEAATFFPARASFEFLTLTPSQPLPEPGDLAINEFLAKNEAGIVNETGLYSDWIELYNNTDAAIDLYGLYLTDDPTDLTQFAFPENTIIQPHDYKIIWADELESTDQYVHCNFKLSADGEMIILSDGGEVVIDSITFGTQTADISMGRCPNGNGAFQLFETPTFNASNCTEGIKETQVSDVTIYPNPATGNFHFVLKDNARVSNIIIYNAQGTAVLTLTPMENSQINATSLPKGLYFVLFNLESNARLLNRLIIN